MKQCIETYHVLQMRRRVSESEWSVWQPISPLEVYRAAELLAYQGRLVEAIEEAQRIQIGHHGHMRDVSFRVKSQTTTITIAAGPWDEAHV